MGVAREGEPQPLFHKNAQGLRVRAKKTGALGWRLRVRDPKQVGKQIERSFYGSQKEATKELLKIEDALYSGEMIPLNKSPKTIKEAAEIWLEAYKWTGRITLKHSGKPDRPYSTWSKAKVQINTYILPRLKPDTRLSALTKKKLEEVLIEMAEKKYKESSINTTVSVMKSLFRDLYRLDLTPTNYAADLSGNWTTNLEKSQEELKIPTGAEVALLVKSLDKHWLNHGPIVSLIAYTGLRWSELAALEWKDIDRKKKLIKVRKSATESGGRRTISTTLKSRSSRRDIVLIDVAEVVLYKLNDIRERNQKKYPQYNWDRLVNGSRGGHISYKTWQRHLLEARKETGINLSAHDLRHAFASELFARNENLQFISNQLGHSSTRITEQTYIHLIEKDYREDAKRISEKIYPVRDI